MGLLFSVTTACIILSPFSIINHLDTTTVGHLYHCFADSNLVPQDTGTWLCVQLIAILLLNVIGIVQHLGVLIQIWTVRRYLTPILVRSLIVLSEWDLASSVPGPVLPHHLVLLLLQLQLEFLSRVRWHLILLNRLLELGLVVWHFCSCLP